jgi:hypothetical protein
MCATSHQTECGGLQYKSACLTLPPQLSCESSRGNTKRLDRDAGGRYPAEVQNSSALVFVRPAASRRANAHYSLSIIQHRQVTSGDYASARSHDRRSASIVQLRAVWAFSGVLRNARSAPSCRGAARIVEAYAIPWPPRGLTRLGGHDRIFIRFATAVRSHVRAEFCAVSLAIDNCADGWSGSLEQESMPDSRAVDLSGRRRRMPRSRSTQRPARP